MKKVSVIGIGYVGLPLALAIEKSGQYDVIAFDIDEEKVKQINKGICPITDGLAEKELKKLKLKATTDEQDLKDTDIFIICVPTPVRDDFTPDYGPVVSASEQVAKFLKKGATVVLESTVNPGTCEEVMIPVLEKVSKLKAVKDFNVGMCPERINPGDPKWNVYNIPRNIGSLDPKKVKGLADFYRSFLDAEVNEVSCLKVAEATKIVENTFRDINIAFVNELAKSFDSLGIDFFETLQGAANKPFAFLPHFPSRGVGGHCIAVDPYYLIKRAAKSGFNHRFLKVARDVNNSMPSYTVRRLQDALNEAGLPVKGTKIAFLGLSYKNNVGDLRNSPCLKIQSELEKLGADLQVHDPYFPDMSNASSVKEALKGARAVVVCTFHDEFAGVEKPIVANKDIAVVVDGLNKLDKKLLVEKGKIYRGMGR